MNRYFMNGTWLEEKEKGMMRTPERIRGEIPTGMRVVPVPGTKRRMRIYIDSAHGQRLREMPFDLCRNPSYSAALYLLSADAALWKRAACAVGENRIHFKRVNLQQAGLYSRVLFDAARRIYWGRPRTRPENICSRELMDWPLYLLCKSACNIRRYGFPTNPSFLF